MAQKRKNKKRVKKIVHKAKPKVLEEEKPFIAYEGEKPAQNADVKANAAEAVAAIQYT